MSASEVRSGALEVAVRLEANTAPRVYELNEVVPGTLRTRLRWDWQHDAAAAEVMQEYGLSLPKDRELIRQLAVTRVAWGKPEWL